LRVLVAGAGGMVGRAVVDHCAAQNDGVFAHDHSSLDITNAEAISKVFEREQPEVVINCAAWTDVDGCESDPVRAMAVNAEAVEALAVGSRRTGASFVTISTDYVFDGKKEGFYTQRDDPAPQSVYGKAKLQGERRAQAATARCIVVRTGWIFGVGGKNFLATVAERARRGEHLKAINDAWGTPTYAPHLAARLRELALRDIPGIYHVVNEGKGTSYEEFTRVAVNLAGCENVEIESVSIDSLRRPAPRPKNSRLRCLLSGAIGLAPLPDWKSALSLFVAQTFK
jgi:dTDP-4-dehydrorhamnose reductase